jgi:hypothetical protein
LDRPPEGQRIEVFCNSVAAAALIPRDVLLAEPRVVARGVRWANWSDAEISDLARNFNVSREAVLRRLLTLNRRCNLPQLGNRRGVVVGRVFPCGKPRFVNLEVLCRHRWREASRLPRPCEERWIDRRFHASGHDAANHSSPASTLP